VRVLLDECLPRRLKYAFGPDHDVTTVPERGWAGTRNGALLQLASGEVDVFVTIDAGLAYQQNLGQSSLAIVLLTAPSNRLDALLLLMPALLEQLSYVAPGQLLRVGSR
jgi:predicted nuclease of predicted toxin-antitoxin system